MTTTERTYFQIRMRISKPDGIDFQNPNNPELASEAEALAALADMTPLLCGHKAWVAVRVDQRGPRWEMTVIGEQSVAPGLTP